MDVPAAEAELREVSMSTFMGRMSTQKGRVGAEALEIAFPLVSLEIAFPLVSRNRVSLEIAFPLVSRNRVSTGLSAVLLQ